MYLRDDSTSVAGMVTKRWTRYGKDRLYVSLSDGTQVGWVDLLGGEERILLPEHTVEFRRAVAEVAPGRQMPSRDVPPRSVDTPVDSQAGRHLRNHPARPPTRNSR